MESWTLHGVVSLSAFVCPQREPTMASQDEQEWRSNRNSHNNDGELERGTREEGEEGEYVVNYVEPRRVSMANCR